MPLLNAGNSGSDKKKNRSRVSVDICGTFAVVLFREKSKSDLKNISTANFQIALAVFSFRFARFLMLLRNYAQICSHI